MSLPTDCSADNSSHFALRLWTKAVRNCPIKINGSSTGHIPIHDKINHEFTIIKEYNFYCWTKSCCRFFNTKPSAWVTQTVVISTILRATKATQRRTDRLDESRARDSDGNWTTGFRVPNDAFAVVATDRSVASVISLSTDTGGGSGTGDACGGNGGMYGTGSRSANPWEHSVCPSLWTDTGGGSGTGDACWGNGGMYGTGSRSANPWEHSVCPRFCPSGSSSWMWNTTVLSLIGSRFWQTHIHTFILLQQGIARMVVKHPPSPIEGSLTLPAHTYDACDLPTRQVSLSTGKMEHMDRWIKANGTT